MTTMMDFIDDHQQQLYPGPVLQYHVTTICMKTDISYKFRVDCFRYQAIYMDL